ncbi:MAG: 3-hydroxyacyl-CoA dehydrogenase NAD-binding domain-containing protein [Rhodospirillales bacterium]|nr:3-hydroxyacyl-CoA dehydrogenase NAD-binding domain-containing protein [Rhodospirillales bacterium]
MNQTAAQLLEKIENRGARVGVVGMGYVGLPLALLFAKAGFKVVGLDIDQAKADSLNRGESYISHIPSAEIVRLFVDGTVPWFRQNTTRSSRELFSPAIV